MTFDVTGHPGSADENRNAMRAPARTAAREGRRSRNIGRFRFSRNRPRSGRQPGHCTLRAGPGEAGRAWQLGRGRRGWTRPRVLPRTGDWTIAWLRTEVSHTGPHDLHESPESYLSLA